MFAGHYSIAYALKAKEKNISLAILFIAVQFVDILFFPFTLLGIEHISFVENYTEVNNFKMDYYPFTHGLLASIIWAFIFYLVFIWIKKGFPNKKRIAMLVALAVFSHWVIDLISHTKDLPLITGDPKFGFGLWNHKLAAFSIEIALLVTGWYYYTIKTKAITKLGTYLNYILLGVLILSNYLNFYVTPATENLVELTISALASYFIFATIAYFVDKKRELIT